MNGVMRPVVGTILRGWLPDPDKSSEAWLVLLSSFDLTVVPIPGWRAFMLHYWSFCSLCKQNGRLCAVWIPFYPLGLQRQGPTPLSNTQGGDEQGP